MKVKVKKLAVLMFFCLLLTSTLFLVKPVASQPTLPTIIIQSNGNVNPSSAPLHRNGNTYTFTDDIYGAIKIFRSNVVLNGAGCTLTGPFDGNSTDIWVVGTGPSPVLASYTIGVDLDNSSVCGVTIEDLNVENFSIGMYIWTQNNTVVGNGVSGNIVGLMMSGSNSTITRNYIANNIEGLFFGFNSPGQFPPDMVVYENAFLKNNVQISGCQCQSYNMSETPHDWDNGKVGNYWSDYNGSSISKDGVGDTPYVIDVLDRDRFPLMQNPVKPPSPSTKGAVNDEAIAVGVSVPAVLVASVFVINQKRRRKHEKRKS